MEKGEILNKINTQKKTKIVKVHLSSKNIISEAPVAEAPVAPLAAAVEQEQEQGELARGEDNGEASLSPDLPGEEAPPPPDNIAFMITNTKVKPLSCGEYQELVNAKKGSVQTVTVGSATSSASKGAPPPGDGDTSVPPDNGFSSKKPVIIIFDEPMDIRSAYKRLSTIFECEEELDRMLSEERIDEESEESDTERRHGGQVNAASSISSSSSSSISEETAEPNGDGKDKKKFKFKFPKKQLAALTQAIRTGSKSGKKTLQVVVYEDEEEGDGTVRQHKEAKRFEVARSNKAAAPKPARPSSESLGRTSEIRKNTYKTLDSLEQTIRQLESTISEMGPPSPAPVDPPAATAAAASQGPREENGKTPEGPAVRRSSSLPKSRMSGPKVASKGFLQKKTKPQLLPRPLVSPTSTTTTTSTTSTTTIPSVPSTIQQVSL